MSSQFNALCSKICEFISVLVVFNDFFDLLFVLVHPHNEEFQFHEEKLLSIMVIDALPLLKLSLRTVCQILRGR